MANSFFQFKQFTIHQSEAALKVCTESCIFGASIPVGDVHHILDIGTGTGLLSLMLAQRSQASIEAIELDEASARDAKKNFIESPWKNRLVLHLGDVKKFSSAKKFDLIISNPPFFIHQFKSPNTRTNTALHGSELKPQDLCTIVNQLSTEDARFFVLLPEQEMILLRHALEATGWHSVYELNIYQEAHKTIFRQVGGFSKKNEMTFVRKQLIIYKNGKTYTEEFIDLLKDYYLYL
ncbi:MAG: methyltransferase protein [Cytophagaceae bacterium]|jgi:tRNA1Val (adenine37-N6)-methyltransferase|nr:methyltransferase protein [Cytophagaceae bacterium]